MSDAFFSGARRAPLVNARIQFPTLGNQFLHLTFLIDTGAWDVSLGTVDARNFEAEFDTEIATLATDPEGYGGIGGKVDCWVIDAIVWIEDKSFDVRLKVLAPYHDGETRIPSLLGRRILSSYTLIAAWPNDIVGLYLP